jgi:pimeloyl-ACP methyl ester carboxylesterase
MTSLARSTLVLFAASLVAGCGGSHGTTATATAAQGDTPWGPCPSGFRDECRSLAMPLDWGSPEGPTIPVFVSRAPSAATHMADLWLVSGGPGQSADAFGAFVDELRADLPGFDIYTIEHRGVGQSARLGCPDQESESSPGGAEITEAEVPACVAAVQAEWNDGLQYFRLTPAARDLAEAIDRTRTPGTPVFVYAVSYGTSVGIRYLQLRPNDAAGVILDSVSPPGIKFFSHYSEQYDPVLHKLADLCAKDSGCAGQLGSDPWAALSGVTQHVAAGACPDAKLTRESLSVYADQLLESDDARVVAMALLHRVDRCTPEDVNAIQAFQNVAASLSGGESPRSSQVLYWNVVFADRWQVPPPSVDEVTAWCAPLALCDDDSIGLARIRLDWPAFPEDPLNTQWPIVTSSPVLMLNGELDPQTPVDLATAFAQKLQSAHQTFVTFPFSAHDTVVQAWAPSADQVPCGYRIVLDFLAHPDKPDTSCVSDSPPVSFDSTVEQAQAWFGTDDLWVNGPADAGGSADALVPDADAGAPD